MTYENGALLTVITISSDHSFCKKKSLIVDLFIFSSRRHWLKVVDLTGFRDDGPTQDTEAMGPWSRTVMLSRACTDVYRQIGNEAKSSLKRRREMLNMERTAASTLDEIAVDVHADLFVNSSSSDILRDALEASSGCSIRLKCRDFRAEELSIKGTVRLLELLDPLFLRKIDLRYNNLGLIGLTSLLLHMVRFTTLVSLKLPYSNIDVRRLTTNMEATIQSFAARLSQLSKLKELNLASSRLSGRLGQLLSGLQSSLESLELSYCYLLPTDVCYLTQSPHASSLKKLDLSGNNLSEHLFSPFQKLLFEISRSLVHLDIMECRLTDSHIQSLLPGLRQCLHLRYLGFFCNPLSTAGLKVLLQNLVTLLDLKLIIYPLPVDCYEENLPWPPSSTNLLEGSINQEKMAVANAALQEILHKAQRTDILLTTDIYTPPPIDFFDL
ncbi:leucine-rich repeat-containing protein 14 [Protopterus annectens]|uniref:leucine-rich repeat-containing protein 14 n=1 Tax=Protopterus annectens TaxID=7888 RepID=UPI001CF9BB7E|nr:leucine-rich repeat-containing protein 14 [Protopterus annectens]